MDSYSKCAVCAIRVPRKDTFRVIPNAPYKRKIEDFERSNNVLFDRSLPICNTCHLNFYHKEIPKPKQTKVLEQHMVNNLQPIYNNRVKIKIMLKRMHFNPNRKTVHKFMKEMKIVLQNRIQHL